MNLNKAIIAGNLTRDPEIRTTPNGQTVASFGVATNRVWTDANGQKQQKAEFHNVVVWGRLAEIAGQYLSKGRLVLVEGRLETRSWEGQDGVKRNRTEIITENLQLGPRGISARSQEPQEPMEQSHETEPESPPKEGKEEIKVEEIPF